MAEIVFKRLTERDYDEFRNDVKNIFSIAVINEFGWSRADGDIISDEDIDASLYNSQCEVYAIYADDEKVGGIVLKINGDTHCNWLDLFYLYPNMHGKGLGQQIWKSIEQKYPQTKVWYLITPYFEKRNIHFYVNKCGFKIVEFFNKAHRDPNRPASNFSFHDEYFVFEKEMMK